MSQESNKLNHQMTTSQSQSTNRPKLQQMSMHHYVYTVVSFVIPSQYHDLLHGRLQTWHYGSWQSKTVDCDMDPGAGWLLSV